ncbi:MAG: TolC family protein [Candidatus Aureabacteria bacterium]|nr:TolC family protein [Candidatus Auribacterota bacterium]
MSLQTFVSKKYDVPDFHPGHLAPRVRGKKLLIRFSVISFFVFCFFISGFEKDVYSMENRPEKEKQVLTLSEFCSRVLNHDPTLKKQSASVEEALAGQAIASSMRWPKVEVAGTFLSSNDPVSVFGMLLKQGAFSQSDFSLERLNNPSSRSNWNFLLQAGLPVFDGLQIRLSAESARYAAESAKRMQSFFKSKTILVAAQAYLNTVLAQLIFDAAGKTTMQAEEDLQQAEQLKTKGMILGADFYAARVVYAGMTQMKNQAQKRIQECFMIMAILAGDPLNDEYHVVRECSEDIPASIPLEEWIQKAFNKREDLLAVRLAVEAKETELKREKAASLPRVSVFASAESNAASSWDEQGTSYTAGLKGTFDLYDPSRSSRIKKIEKELEQLIQDEKILQDRIVMDMTSAWKNEEVLFMNLDAARQSVQDSSEAVKLVEPLYREGRKSIADLLEMRMASQSAANNLDEIRTKLEILRIQLLFLSGELDERRLVEIGAGIKEEG